MANQPVRRAPAGNSRTGRPAAKRAPAKRTSAARASVPKDILIIAIIGILVIAAAFVWQSRNTEGFDLVDNSAADTPVVTEIHAAGAVRINEVMSANDSAWYTEAGVTADWVEIMNTSSDTIDIEGYVITQTADDTNRFVFPSTVLAPGQTVIVFCDSTNHNTAGYEFHAPFSISRAGDSVMLFNASGTAVDSVNVPSLTNNVSYARTDDMQWEATAYYTPGMANTRENHESITQATVESPITVTEVMARNSTYDTDGSGLYYDYIEIYNGSDQDIDISGYHLSDDRNDVMKWTFPKGTVIGAGQYILVHAAGTDMDGLYAGFGLSSEGETVVLTNEKGQILQIVEFGLSASDQAWSLDQDGTFKNTLPPTPGMANTQESAALISDRFAAQNGIGVYITEIAASTTTAKYDWVEIYNATSSVVDLSGYGLSDDSGTPRKWLFPAGTTLQPGEYMGVYCTGLTGIEDSFPTADFALNAEGGYHITLCTPEGRVFDRIYMPLQHSEITYGRKAGEYGRCYYFTNPSPIGDNYGASYARMASEARYSVKGGAFDYGDVIVLELSADPGDLIFYTTDCTEPTTESHLYTGPITITDTTIVRTRVYSDGALESYMNCQSYLFGIDHTVRVVSLVSDPDGLFSYENGILVKGPNATEKYPYGSMNRGANFWMDWEREAHIEMFDVDGSVMISQECGIKLHGQYSRAESQKAFKVYARSRYSGESTFAAPIFSNRDYQEYSSFLLRASGQDIDKTRMRDSILTSLAADTGLYYQETEICVVYLNGEYYGHYNIREHVNADSICQFHGWEGQEDDIDLVKANTNLMQGSDDSYQALLKWVKNNDMTTDEAYEVISSVIDVDNYIAYMALEIFTGNTDTLNVKRYRNPNADGLWRWCLFDLDWAFTTDTNSIGRWLTPGGMGNMNRTDNTLFIACMKNPRFRDEFLTYMGSMMAGPLTTRNVYDKTMERYDLLMPEMEKHCLRWGADMNGYSVDRFTATVKDFLKYAYARPTKLLGYFKDSMKLSDAEMEHYFGAAFDAIEEFEVYYQNGLTE